MSSKEKVDLGFALNLQNDKAIAYLANKSIVPASVFKTMGESAHAKAFTVANINHLGLLTDMKKGLDDAMQKGLPFEKWRDNLFQSAAAKGWVNRSDIMNPETGEVLAPWRLRTIFKTNTATAFQAARYQSQMENAIDFPYLEFVAVGDAVTRPSHMALSGTVKRYDDPFWQAYYPPLDYNCRCTVVSRSEYYVKKRGIEIDETPVEEDEIGDVYVEKQGVRVKPAPSFKYNTARHGFRPNLDQYDSTLATQFCERDMAGHEFKLQYERLEREYQQERKRLSIKDAVQLQKKQIDALRTQNRHHLNFSAGVILDDLPVPTKTVWLSDDTILKQFNSRLGDANIGLAYYATLPRLIARPDYILRDGTKYIFLTKVGEQYAQNVLRITRNKEVYLDSTHYLADKRIQQLIEKLEVIKKP